MYRSVQRVFQWQTLAPLYTSCTCMTRNPRVYCPAGQVENIPCPVRADFMYIRVYVDINNLL